MLFGKVAPIERALAVFVRILEQLPSAERWLRVAVEDGVNLRDANPLGEFVELLGGEHRGHGCFGGEPAGENLPSGV